VKGLPRAFCFGAIAMMAGCGLFIPKETRYLMSAKNHATQAEVTEKLGKPIESKVTETGDSIWVYHVRALQPGNYLTAPGEWCDEYALVFDKQGMLRDWIHRSYFHGGETMPTYCVPDGLSPKD
jgi:hypothetical protein